MLAETESVQPALLNSGSHPQQTPSRFIVRLMEFPSRYNVWWVEDCKRICGRKRRRCKIVNLNVSSAADARVRSFAEARARSIRHKQTAILSLIQMILLCWIRDADSGFLWFIFSLGFCRTRGAMSCVVVCGPVTLLTSTCKEKMQSVLYTLTFTSEYKISSQIKNVSRRCQRVCV